MCVCVSVIVIVSANGFTDLYPKLMELGRLGCRLYITPPHNTPTLGSEIHPPGNDGTADILRLPGNELPDVVCLRQDKLVTASFFATTVDANKEMT